MVSWPSVRNHPAKSGVPLLLVTVQSHHSADSEDVHSTLLEPVNFLTISLGLLEALSKVTYPESLDHSKLTVYSTQLSRWKTVKLFLCSFLFFKNSRCLLIPPRLSLWLFPSAEFHSARDIAA